MKNEDVIMTEIDGQETEGKKAEKKAEKKAGKRAEVGSMS